MNPFVVWMPTIAAAAIFATAAYISMDEDAIEEPPHFKEPEQPVYETPMDTDVMDPLTSDADLDSAARDDDGSDILEIMENQLRMARRIASSNKNSAPTKKGRRDLKALANKAGYGLKKLTQMRNTVPDPTFARAEVIVQEIKALTDEIDEAYKQYREERSESPEPDAADVPQAPPAAVPQAPPDVVPQAMPAAPVYQPAELDYEQDYEQDYEPDEDEESTLI
jgi:hypothetical protein